MLGGLAAALALVLGSLPGAPAPAPSSPAIGESTGGTPQRRAYVWQRVWSPALSRDLRLHGAAFDALDLLGSEVAFSGAAPTIHDASPDWAAVRAAGRPVGVVVRIGSSHSLWAEDSVETKEVLEVCAADLERARSHQVQPVELQLDFDAATSGLIAYRALLVQVRRAIAPTRLTFTALPTWLSSPDFRALIDAADGYVLQVHSLEKPASPEQAFTLCDPVRAKRWIAGAAAFGRPFRVALPTYGYRVAFGPSGRFLGLQAEGAQRAWPDGSQVRVVWADAHSLAHLVNGICAANPPNCEALCWFRFPCDDDELAWRWPTLAEVMKGIEPRAHLVASATPAAGGTRDVLLCNEGTDRTDAVAFRLSWRQGRLVAGDAIAGWSLERVSGREVMIRPPKGPNPISIFPGDRIGIGWLRFDEPVKVEASFP